MRYLTILFDFDGTLADTENAMRESLNAVAPAFGFVPVSVEENKTLRDMNAREFLTKRLRIPVWNLFKVSRLIRSSKREFAARSAGAQLFSGTAELLRSFKAQGYRIGIVSTNDIQIMRNILGDSIKDIDFLETGSLLFGKSRALRRTLRKYGLDRNAVVYIGDELRDAHTCRSVGIPMIGVGWGLTSIHALAERGIDVVTTHEELSEMIKNYG